MPKSTSEAEHLPEIENVNLFKNAERSRRAGVTGYNMHYALPLALTLLFGLYSLVKLFD